VGRRPCRGNGYNEIRQLSFGLIALLNPLATKLVQRIDVAVCGMGVIGGYLGKAVTQCIYDGAALVLHIDLIYGLRRCFDHPGCGFLKARVQPSAFPFFKLNRLAALKVVAEHEVHLLRK
jgi:hypothetical protein